jgi:hypothetical protein
MNIERRLNKLETLIPQRCRACGRLLHCQACEYGRDLHEATDQELLSVITHGMRRLIHQPGFFESLGLDLNKLTVEELQELRRLLDKMGDTPAAEEPCTD